MLKAPLANVRVGFGVGVVGFMGEVAISVVIFPIILRYMERSEAGIWMLFGTIGMLIAAPLAGVTPAVVRAVAGARATGGQQSDMEGKCPPAINTIYLRVITLGITLGIAGSIYINRSAQEAGVSGLLSISCWLLYIGGWGVRTWASRLFAILDGHGVVGLVRIGTICAAATNLILLVCVLPVMPTLIAPVVAFVIGSATFAVLAQACFRWRYPSGRRTSTGLGISERELTRDSVLLAILAASGYMVNYGPIFVVENVVGAAGAALFIPVARIALLMSSASALSHSLFAPYITAAWKAGDVRRLSELVKWHMCLPIMIYSVASAPIMMWPREAMEMWLGEGNVWDVRTVRWFITYGWLLTMHTSLCVVIVSTKTAALLKEAVVSVVTVYIAIGAVTVWLGVAFIPLGMCLGLAPVSAWLLLTMHRLLSGNSKCAPISASKV